MSESSALRMADAELGICPEWSRMMGTDHTRKKRFRIFVAALGLLFVFCGAGNVQAHAKQVKLGRSISVAKKGAVYTSSDKAVAYVSDQGRVTGKKTGQAVITVKKGKKATRYTVKVKADGAKKGISVCPDEIKVAKIKTDYTPLFREEAGEDAERQTEAYTFRVTVRVKNTGASAAKRIRLTGRAGDEKVVLDFGKVKAKASKEAEASGKAKSAGGEFTPERLEVYSGQMLSIYDYTSDSLSLRYGTADKTKPVISGFVGEDSYNRDSKDKKIPCQVIYSDDKDYDWTKYVSATDDRDGEVELTVDTSRVNFKKNGNYTVIYTARDKAGNVAKAKATVGIRKADSLEKEVDKVLRRIIKPSWSDTQKARAIYDYTRRHISYTGHSDKSDWAREAKRGIIYGYGDCFTYYAVARALLTRVGIPNIEVTRVKGYGRHWWNLVYVQDGFYHFDTCPRRQGGKFCLVTDEQLQAYSRSHGNSHIWDYSKKPKSAAKKISGIF